MKDSRRHRRLALNVAPSAVLAGGLLIAWEIGVHVTRTPAWLLPAPSRIAAALTRTWPILWQHTLQTLWEAVLGLGVALVVGVTLAALMDFWRPLRRALYPLLIVSQTIPPFAIAPLLVIWLGFGVEPKIVVVALVCFFPIAVNTADGLFGADPDLVALLKAMGASRRQIWVKVRLPSALPAFFGGLRIAATYSVLGAIFGEWVGARSGLGIYLQRSFSASLTDQVFATIVVIAALSMALFGAILLIERLALPWYFSAAREEVWTEPGIY